MREGSTRDRSVSGDIDDSDVEAAGPGKPGRKKNPNSQAARRDQNRIAQREFRLRKQQRIRDLEARVEILSGGKDEALTEIRNILKDLMEENQTLRGLLRSLSSFIGEGAGGILPKMGWDMTDFNNFVNRSETDTAWESFQRRKKNNTNPSMSSTSQDHHGQKRPADNDSSILRPKKPRAAGEHDNESEQSQERFGLLMPMTSNTMYPPSTRSHEPGLFPELLQSSTGSPMFGRLPSVSASSPYNGTSSSGASTYQYVPPLNVNVDAQVPSLPFPSTNAHGSIQQRLPHPDSVDDADDSGNVEELKLIHYHLDNYKRNTSYCLPPSLRPSLVQKTIPHQSIIDSIIHPDLRDRMILLTGRFDLAECLMEYKSAVTIHGDDVLAHSNWEIGEAWLRRFGFLVDQSVLNIANRWRRERGEPELLMSDIAPADHTPNPT